jgi:hypothetical protein
MNTQITQGNYGAGQVDPLNATGGPATAGSITATIDNYAAAYVAPFVNPGPRWFIVVPKLFNPGTTTVTVTINGTDASGNSLPSNSVQYDIVGAAGPAPATQFSIANVTTTTTNPPADPGVPTVTLS